MVEWEEICKYRKCGWQIEKLGAVGENILHLCLLNATSVHAELAKRLIRTYPCLINDIYTSDEYYGKVTHTISNLTTAPRSMYFIHSCGMLSPRFLIQQEHSLLKSFFLSF